MNKEKISAEDVLRKYVHCICTNADKERGLADADCAFCNSDWIVEAMQEYADLRKQVSLLMPTDEEIEEWSKGLLCGSDHQGTAYWAAIQIRDTHLLPALQEIEQLRESFRVANYGIEVLNERVKELERLLAEWEE